MYEHKRIKNKHTFGRSVFFEKRFLFWSFLLGDVGQLSSRLVDGQAPELLVEIDWTVEVEIAQVETLLETVRVPAFQDEHVVALCILSLKMMSL